MVYMEWERLGVGYPGDDEVARAMFDVLAPVDGRSRTPIYEGGREETPRPKDVWALAERLAAAVRRVVQQPAGK